MASDKAIEDQYRLWERKSSFWVDPAVSEGNANKLISII